MVNLTWEDIGEHIDKGDLKEWLKEERAKDKARQLSEDADTPQTERKCIDCKFLTYMFGKTWCNIKCDNPHDKVCDRFKPKDTPQTDCGWGKPNE